MKTLQSFHLISKRFASNLDTSTSKQEKLCLHFYRRFNCSKLAQSSHTSQHYSNKNGAKCCCEFWGASGGWRLIASRREGGCVGCSVAARQGHCGHCHTCQWGSVRWHGGYCSDGRWHVNRWGNGWWQRLNRGRSSIIAQISFAASECTIHAWLG